MAYLLVCKGRGAGFHNTEQDVWKRTSEHVDLTFVATYLILILILISEVYTTLYFKETTSGTISFQPPQLGLKTNPPLIQEKPAKTIKKPPPSKEELLKQTVR